MIQKLPCLMKRGFWEKIGKLCVPYVGVTFLAIHINLSPSQSSILATALSVEEKEEGECKQWKYIAGPGNEPETTVTLVKSSATEPPRPISMV